MLKETKQIKRSEEHITANKNGIPFDPEKPTVTSGLRLGTPAGTTRGFKEEEFRTLMKTETTREKARRCSREIVRDRNDTGGGGKVILVLLKYFNLNNKS